MYEVVLELVLERVMLTSENETGEEEVEFDGPTGDPEVTDPEGTGGPQLPVP